MTSISAQEWDARYRNSELVWGAKPNRWVEQEVAALRPLAQGVGGPQDPAVLYTAADVTADLAVIDPRAEVEIAERVERPVEGAQRPALDALVRARKS